MILGFVARRLLAESVAMVFGVREPTTRRDFDGLPELQVHGLAEEDARTLLMRAVPGRLDDRVRDRVVAETRGNPLALLDLPRSMSPAELAGGFGLVAATDLPRHLEDHYVRRAGELPEATRQLLLLAAAEPIGDATLVWRAAHSLGVEKSSLTPAEDAELVEIRTRSRFRHPLVRSAVYRAASPSERRAAHRALAEATDPNTDPDRLAWHRAQAAVGVDEAVAAELERSAGRAQARGGAAAAAAFLARAAELTPDPAERGRRAMAAAQAKFDPGHRMRRSSCLQPPSSPRSTSSSAPGSSGCARSSYSRARAAVTLRPCCSMRPGASNRLTPRWLARRISRRLRRRCSPVASAADRTSVRPPRRRGLRRPRLSRHGDRPAARWAGDEVHRGLLRRSPPLQKAIGAFRDVEGLTAPEVRWLWLACRVAQDLWDDESWHALATRGVRVARETGALTLLPGMVNFLAALHVHSGEFASAAAVIDEVDALTEATGIAPLKYAATMLRRRAATRRSYR